MIFKTLHSWLALTIAAAFVIACSDDSSDDGPPQEPECLVEPANAACTNLLFTDTSFTSVFSNILQPQCAAGPCHSAEFMAGGLNLSEQSAAHAALLANGSDSKPRVVPGNVQCGKLIVRLEVPGEEWSMPRGSQQLSDEARCVIRHWIADGAMP